ncbi:hypothetical protein AB0P17_39995 [Streptomyces sp. NPDC088124]|uniref:hypothetical protein n=1 Tax=Streptomyces sp. NPDC088124 TaxID=3154654 RepID=UPI00344616BC
MASDNLIQNLRERHRTSRAAPSGRVARRALGLTMALGVTGASIGVFGAGPAAADSVSRKLRYTCSASVIHWSGTVNFIPNVPKLAVVGTPTPKFVIRVEVPVTAADARELRNFGVKTIKGTVKAKVRVSAPEGDTHRTVPFHVARTDVPASGPFVIKATGDAPKLTFSRPGPANITVGDLIANVSVGGAVNLTVEVPCKLDGGQNNTVASFDITETRTTTKPSPSKAPDTATSGTTGSQSPSEGVRAGAPTEDSAGSAGSPATTAGPSGSLATTGSQGVTSLIPLATGTAALGTLVAAAAFRFRRRSG